MPRPKGSKNKKKKGGRDPRGRKKGSKNKNRGGTSGDEKSAGAESASGMNQEKI